MHSYSFAVLIKGIHMKQHCRKYHSGTEGEEQSAVLGSSEDPCLRTRPSFFQMRLTHGPGMFQRISALCPWAQQMLPSAFCSPQCEESIAEERGTNGIVWLLATERKLVGEGKTQSNQLPSAGEVAARGRKKEIMAFSYHTSYFLSSLFLLQQITWVL